MSVLENTDQQSYVLVQIGQRRFAVSATTVSELAPPVRLHQFPQTSPLVAGVIVRRGRIVPVYDVSRILDGKNSPAHRFYLVATRDFGTVREASAIPADGECELVTAPITTADATSPKYISGTITVGEESIQVLDLNALVASASTEPSEIEYPRSRA
jgi:chemotaxis signal transduction protein